jgi:hypothetical protein
MNATSDHQAGGVHGEGFFDPETGGRPRIELHREGPLSYRLARRFGYRDAHHAEPFLVPADVASFRTDLTSVPWVFGWLVPGLGTHLPAVLLHDALVSDGDPTHLGPEVSREEADRVFRDAMRHLGTPLIRRWLIWAGVAVGATWTTARPALYWRTLTVAFFFGLASLGVVTTLDLLDVGWRLPWLGERPWYQELVIGGVLAVLIPVVAALAWGRRWAVGAIGGVALAVLLPPTALVVPAFGVYWTLERLVSRHEGATPNPRENVDPVP